MSEIYPFSFDLTKPVNVEFDGTMSSLPWLPSATHPSCSEKMCLVYGTYKGTHAGVSVEIPYNPGDMFSASIPDWAEVFTYSDYDPKVDWAALTHDNGYKYKMYPRNVMDTMFNDLCRAAKTDKTRRKFMRKALQWFGSKAWNRRK